MDLRKHSFPQILAIKSWLIPLSRKKSTSKSSRRRLGLLFFAALRLHEPKSREGVLGPDLRVLILLEYPGVSPTGSPGKVQW